MNGAMKTLFILIFLSLAWPCQAEVMGSANFSLGAAGFSNGGEPSSSASFMMTATLGQSTPLRLTTYPTSSSSRSFPGLRYQLEEYGIMGINQGFLPGIYMLLLLNDVQSMQVE